MTVSRTHLVSIAIGVCLIAVATVFGILPLSQQIHSLRSSIDQDRASVIALQEKQQNIVTVSRDFSTISQQNETIGRLYLNDATAVSFYNTIDDLFAKYGVTNGNVRLDNSQGAGRQPSVTAHLSFVTAYSNVRQMIRDLTVLPFFVSVQTVALRSDASGLTNATIDIAVPWEAQP